MMNIVRNPRLYLALAIVALLLLCTVGPFKFIFDSMFVIHYLQEHRCCIRTPFIIVYALLTVIGIPGAILTIAAGVVFGLWYGTLWTVIGATLGALGAFWMARYLLRNYIQRKFANNKRLAKFQAAVVKKPVSFVLAVRFAPISPFNVVNFLFGLTPIHWFPYTYATFIGIIPGTLAYTWLGTSGIRAIEGENPIPLVLALLLLTLLSLIPFWVKSIHKLLPPINRPRSD
jgi:uncharacterized membrane protein YdjX (TVP38/TMEM64 family)